MTIDQVREAIRSFFEKTFGRDAKVIKITKSEDGWVGEAEIYEESSFIKSLGIPTRMQDRNTYEIKLTDTLEVTSYTRKEEAATAG
jgi:alcohol dehydrogenase YqhD (iron-dependent ADH family)